MQLQILNSSNEQTMSSKEIAELTGKEHKNILADIRKLLIELEISEAEFSAADQYLRPDGSSMTRQIFNLPKRECLILVSGYSIKMRAAIVDRWQELEAQVAQKPMTSAQSFLQIAQFMVDTEQRQFQLENSQKKLEEKVEILTSKAEAIIDQSDYFSVMGYCRLKKISISNAKASGLSRSIGKYCDDNIIPKQEIADPRFGKVWTYPSAVILKFLTLKGFIAGE